MSANGFDYDWLVIGSGFGGSVSALRLSEKGYRVGVLECGKRYEDADFAESTSQLSRYYWAPFLGLKGILRMTLFKDVLVGTGCGVGGGSLGYANTLYRSRPEFAKNPQWSQLADWDAELAPHYDTAEHMLGVVRYDEESAADVLMKEYASEKGFADTYTQTRVGVFLGTPGKTVPDPFFAGAGPERTGCVKCGACMVGCRHGAKNTLMKNYLWFAERRGAQIQPERTVVDVRPLGDSDGGDGHAVTSVRSGRWVRKDRQTVTARGVIFAAGPLGTNRLLQRCKLSGALPKLSDRLGKLVRTNSESILAVTASGDTHDFARSIAITSSIYPAPDTHIEPVTYGQHGNTQSLIFALATAAGRRGTRPFYFLLNALRHPRKFVRSLRIRKWSGRTVILLVMQTVENSISLRVKFRLPGGFPVLTTEQDPENPIPDSIPAAYEAGEWFAERINGTLQAATPEAVLSIPSTAHLLGGAVIGESPQTGVINARHEVYGYQNLLVCDGSAIPANVGVNPSLTITAMAERAMTFVAPKPGAAPAEPIRFTATPA
ncbi:MAG: GMC oxidoreductase [Micromonosporaceae bacterium]